MSDAQTQPRTGGASLDILRFLAAGFILLYHYGDSAPVLLGKLLPVFNQGWLATDFFLLLSGYILTRSYGRRLASSGISRTRFFLRRFARLWPSHIVVLLMFGLFIMGAHFAGFPPREADKYGGWAFFAQAFLVHGWGMFTQPAWNVPTWTISALLVCYALFSLYVPLVYNRSVAVMAGLVILVLVAANVLAVYIVGHAFVDLQFEFGLLRAIPLFITGSLIERMTANLRVSQMTFWLVLVAVVVGMGILQSFPRNAFMDSAALVLLAVVLAMAGGVTFNESPVTQRLGRTSFALFLIHSLVGAAWFGIVRKLVADFGLGLPAQWGLWCVGVVLAVAAAFAFEASVDRPLSQWVSRQAFLRSEV